MYEKYRSPTIVPFSIGTHSGQGGSISLDIQLYIVLDEDGVYNYLKHKLLLKIERKSLTFILNSCYKPLFLAGNIRPAVDQADTINKPAC